MPKLSLVITSHPCGLLALMDLLPNNGPLRGTIGLRPARHERTGSDQVE